MDKWLQPALDYIRSWLEFQMRVTQQPGLIIAIAHRDRIVLEHGFGHADLSRGEKLTPRHRFRIASHSKSFTAAGVMKLREQRKLHLDDPVGQYVEKLHPRIAEVTIGQLLSHSGGLVRDGADGGQFADRRPFLSAAELLADLQQPPVIEPNTRLKYSNHGFALLGLAIEAITGEPYKTWIKKNIVDAAGLRETEPDMLIPRGTPFARGHTAKALLGTRLVVPGDARQNAITPAGGFVSTASDLARYFAQLAPGAKRSVISASSRRDMIRRQWRDLYSSQESFYGYGIISGTLGGWDWFGHSGGLHGYVSRTAVLPARELTICLLSNSNDGWAGFWTDGAIHILRNFATRGVPTRRVRDWAGRWWSNWGALDLVPLGDIVLGANPHGGNPFADATEVEITGRDAGRMRLAGGYASHGEPVRRVRNKAGAVTELWWSAARLLPEAQQAAEMRRRYGGKKRGG